jgi:hypothetical protein
VRRPREPEKLLRGFIEWSPKVGYRSFNDRVDDVEQAVLVYMV